MLHDDNTEIELQGLIQPQSDRIRDTPLGVKSPQVPNLNTAGNSNITSSRSHSQSRLSNHDGEIPTTHQIENELSISSLGYENDSRDLPYEPKKEACSNIKLSFIKHLWVFHVPSVAFTLVLSILYIRHVTWTPPGPSPGALVALQFAAKAHEALIVISLADILLHRIRYELMEGDSISLGYLSSAFYLASPLGYLLSWEFWGIMLHPTRNHLSHFLTGFLIILLFLIGLGAAPLSAVAMIPRLQWLEMRQQDLRGPSFDIAVEGGGDKKMVLSNFFLSNDPYHMEFNGSNLPQLLSPDECVPGFPCPGLSSLGQLLLDLKAKAIEFNYRSNSNFSYTIDGPRNSWRPISILPAKNLISLTALSTGPMEFLARFLQHQSRLLFTYSDRDCLIRAHKNDPYVNQQDWKQPVVAVGCFASTAASGLDGRPWVFTGKDPVFGSVNISLTAGEELISTVSTTGIDLLNGADIGILKSSGVAVPDVQDQISKPVSGAILFGGQFKPSILYPGWTGSSTLPIRHLCLVQARWVNADVWVNTGMSTGAQTNPGFSLDELQGFMRDTSQKKNTIRLDKDWFLGLSPQGPSRRRLNSTLTYEVMYHWAVSQILVSANGTFGLPWGLPRALSIYLAEALTLAGHMVENGTSEFGKPETGQIPGLLEASFYWHLYAYTFRRTSAILFAFTLLFSHVLIVIVHSSVIIFSPKPWHSNAWRSSGELMALAWRSRAPPGLCNIGAGVASRRNWQISVGVRESEKGNTLEMVSNGNGSVFTATGVELGDSSMRRARVNVEYR